MRRQNFLRGIMIISIVIAISALLGCSEHREDLVLMFDSEPGPRSEKWWW